MKKIILSVLAVVFLVSCTSDPQVIVVSNPAGFDRTNEIVEVKTAGLNYDFAAKTYILKNEKGVEIPYQLLAGNETLIFQADIPANSNNTYTLTEGTPAEAKAKVYARYIPERKDDFAWENEYAAYRMYGPALANENPSNGVDLWLKRTDELIVDKFYHDELVNGLSYHIDHGQGLDCYKVGHTLGAGGIAPYTSELWVGNHYNKQEVIENGPLRAIFKLTYDSVQVDDTYYKQTIIITVDAGSVLNKAEVNLEGAGSVMKLAGGIYLHEGAGDSFVGEDSNMIVYAEDAVSDAGVPSGRNYVGVYMPDVAAKTKKDGDHLLVLADYQPGSEFTYYFGGGWSKWQFPNDEDWFNAMNHFDLLKKNPLKISIQ